MRLSGILVLAVGLLRIPLPQADYHEIRHQHGAGEICVHHDHLLRWHPRAGKDQRVAVLHLHWYVPADDADSGGDDQEGSSAPSGPAFHAHADGLEPNWVGDLVIQDNVRGRFISADGSSLVSLKPLPAPGWLSLPPWPDDHPLKRLPSRTPCAIRGPLVDLFQQHNC